MTKPVNELFEVPNLDGMSMDPDDLRIAGDVFVQLAEYCRVTSTAMCARLDGRITAAIRHEHSAQIIYNSLPGWAKW